jgi:hypothetical protein
MPKHDYRCPVCDNIEADVVVPYGEPFQCDVCSSPMNITYELWDESSFSLVDHGRSRNEKLDHNNFIKNWSATDDPLTRLEVLSTNLKDRSIRTFTPEQQSSFRRRIMVDGDSPQIRKDILATRKANIQSARAERTKRVGKIEGTP